MDKILGFLSSVLAWLLKNGNMLVGIITAVVKAVCGIINVFQPSKDDLVDKVQEWGERIQGWIFKLTEVLKKFKGFIG